MAGDHTGMLAEASLHTHPGDFWGPLIRFLAFAGLGDDDRARQELDDALAIEQALDNEAAFIAEELRDVPVAVRTTIRQRLLDWLASQADAAPARADG